MYYLIIILILGLCFLLFISTTEDLLIRLVSMFAVVLFMVWFVISVVLYPITFGLEKIIGSKK